MGNRSFFAELKRRNVLRAATFYAASAWLVVQVVTQVSPYFHIADWAVRWIIVAAAIGFPFAMVFSWFYEWTPQGIQRESEVAPDASVTRDTGKKLERWTIAILGLAVVLLLADRFVLHRGAAGADTAASTPKSIAVLPLRNLSSDKENIFFADALGEEIINSLARTPDLRVASRTASFAFRDSSKPPAEIAARLGVATLLEGSVQRSGGKLRITVQLVRAADGFELWSEDYDRTDNDVLAVEEDVARSIAGALKIATDPEALAAMQRAGTRSVPAYQAYLKGLSLYFKANAGDFDLYPEAIAAAHQATSIDPGFGDAYAFAAFAEWTIVVPTNMKTPKTAAIPYAQRLHALQADLDGAIANARSPLERKKYQAIQAALEVRLRDAVTLMSDYVQGNPNDAYAAYYLSVWLVEIGDYPRARALAESMARVSPVGAGDEPLWIMLRARDARRAGELARQALAQEPDNIELRYQAHRALLSVGATADAAALLPRLLASNLPDASKRMVEIRQACAEGRRADAERMLDSQSAEDDWAISLRWQQLLLLGRKEEADRLLDRYDNPDLLFSLSTYMPYPAFDASQYPLLRKALEAQGIKPAVPLPESYACKPAAATR